MPAKPDHQTLLRQAARQMRHALDPVAWAAEQLNWHADPWQADLLRSTDPQVAVRVARQAGKTATVSVLAAHQSVMVPKSLILVVSPSQRQATELVTKVRALLRTPALGIKLVADAATSLELPNGSRVVSVPASPENLRGYSAPAIIIEDELAFIPDEVHDALRPMLGASRNGRFILLSTPAGRAGHFHAACQNKASWREFVVTAYDIPRIDKAWLENERYERGDLHFSREFMVEFSSSQFSFFGADLIEAAFNCSAEPLRFNIFT